jgi:hypothetical protein
MKKQKTNFQTHIPEPRWQQVVSIIIVVVSVLAWLFFILFARNIQ